MTDKQKKTDKYYSPILKTREEKKNDPSFKLTRYRMKLAARIADRIKDLGWKNVDLANALNKTEPEISKWLSGRHAFNSDTLYFIGEALGINLINFEDNVQPQSVQKAEVKTQWVLVKGTESNSTPTTPSITLKYALLVDNNSSNANSTPQA
jgi:ribosome-binding protein aMBF1 (putative translation factor)